MFAVQITVRKGLLGLFLEDSLVIGLDGIPILFVSFVEIVDSRKVQIFFVPAEDRFPGSDVAVGVGDSFDEDRSCVSEERVEVCQVPATCRGRHERLVKVSAVHRGSIFDGFPELG